MAGVSYWQLISNNRGYRRLWLGNVCSFLGDWFNLVALYTAVQAITSSSTAIALVMVVKTLPNFLVAPIAGPIVDRYDRRSLLLAMDGIRAVCTLGLVVAHAAGSLVGLYLVAAVMVTCTGVAFPAKKSALPQLVPSDHISAANALSGGTWSIMLAIGAALGGFATATLGVTASFLIDGLTFLASAAFFSGLPKLRPPAKDEDERTTFVAGLRYLRRTPYVLSLVCLKPLMSFANGSIVLIPLYGTIAFGGTGGALFVGLLYGARGLGATFGSFAIRMIIGDSPVALRRWMVAAFLMMTGALVYLASAEALWQAAIGYFVAAVGSSSIWVFSGTLLQIEANRSYHGRLFALEFGVTTLVLAGSGFVYGVLNDWGMTLSEVTSLAAIAALPAALFWAAALLWLRNNPGADTRSTQKPEAAATPNSRSGGERL